MARAKTGSTQDITPMPFPGESPTVALAMAAGRKYGLSDEKKESPRRSAKTAKKKPARRAKPAKPAAKARPARGRTKRKAA